jgi:hypothetical protein
MMTDSTQAPPSRVPGGPAVTTGEAQRVAEPGPAAVERLGVPVAPPEQGAGPKLMEREPPAPIEGRYTGRSAASPYGLSRLAPAFDLVQTAREIEKADAQLATVTGGKLMLLAEQIRALQAKAEHLLTKAKIDAELHRVRCAFEKRVGGVYHLYRDPDGSQWFSLFGPDEWRTGAPDFVASYRLEADMSFTDLKDLVEEAEIDREELRAFLASRARRAEE